MPARAARMRGEPIPGKKIESSRNLFPKKKTFNNLHFFPISPFLRQACLLDRLKGEEDATRVKAVTCIMGQEERHLNGDKVGIGWGRRKSPNPLLFFPIMQCVSALGLDGLIPSISQCAGGVEGQRMLQKMGEETNKVVKPPDQYFIPFITVNGVSRVALYRVSCPSLHQFLFRRYTLRTRTTR